MMSTTNELDVQLLDHVQLLDQFRGDLPWIIQSIQANSSAIQYPTLSDNPSGGIVIWPGLDLGHCGEKIFEEACRQSYPDTSHRNLIRKCIGKRADSASQMFSENSTDLSQLPDLTTTPSNVFTDIVSTILDEYWKKLTKLQPSIQSHDIDPMCQTVLLHFSFIHGLRSSRSLSIILEPKVFNSRILLAKSILDINSKTNSVIISQACESEISYLLKESLYLSDSVGVNGTNQSDDVTRVANRLNDLGFLNQSEFPVSNGVIDWSPLNEFIQIIEFGEQATCNGLLVPGSIVHLWLSSSAAPKMESKLLNPLAQQPIVACNWFWETVEQSVKELIRVCRTESEASNELIEPEFSAFSFTSYGLEFSISLPSSDDNSCNSTTDPNFDRPMMNRICQVLLSRQYVNGVQSLLLLDQETSLLGLTIIGGASTHLTVKLFRPTLCDLESTAVVSSFSDIGDNHFPSINIPDDPFNPPENPTDAVFDHYMTAIQSVPSAHVVNPLATNTLHLLGITGWKDRRQVPDDKDGYNDTIIAMWIDAQGTKIVKEYIGSTAPGKYSKFYNTKGDAHLIPGRYAYKRGKHNGYDALVQAEEFKVWRDPHKDGERRNDSIVEEGWYGINIHAAGTGTKVGNWSAGCQVIWGGRNAGSPFETFMTDVHSMVTGNDVVYYTLVDSLTIDPLPEVNNGGGQ